MAKRVKKPRSWGGKTKGDPHGSYTHGGASKEYREQLEDAAEDNSGGRTYWQKNVDEFFDSLNEKYQDTKDWFQDLFEDYL